MKESNKLNQILQNIDSYTREKAVWIAKPNYECSVSSRPEDLGSYFSYHFNNGEFSDRETMEYSSPKEVLDYLKNPFLILDKDENILALGCSSFDQSLAPLNDFFKIKNENAVEIKYFDIKNAKVYEVPTFNHIISLD